MQVRSPSALVASLVCLVAAGALALTATPSEAGHMAVAGELAEFQPDPAWTEVTDVLHGATYQVIIEGVNDLVLLTGVEPGWEDHFVIADAIVLLETEHPETGAKVIVLTVEDPEDVEHEILG